MDEKEAEARPVMGTIFLVGRAKRALHWGVQSRFRVIYICRYVVCLSYVKLLPRRNYVRPTRKLKVFFLAVKAVTPVLFISYTLEL